MIKIDGIARRNLQEQVGYNSEQIEKIFELLDGLNVQDNLIKLVNSSGTLTAEEFEVVERDVAFIIYNNNLFIKTNTSPTEYTFKQVALSASDQGTYNILQSFRIVVTRANGNYVYSSNTVLALYNKAEMDSLLSAKADTTSLALKANIAGQAFTGGISAPSIIENMSGYSASMQTKAGITFESIYVGAVKTGNKVTFCAYCYVTRTDDVVGNLADIVEFTIPQAVADKLYPDENSWLNLGQLYLASAFNAGITTPTIVEKSAYYPKITFRLTTLSNLALNTKYRFRFEITFLLSDSLVS